MIGIYDSEGTLVRILLSQPHRSRKSGWFHAITFFAPIFPGRKPVSRCKAISWKNDRQTDRSLEESFAGRRSEVRLNVREIIARVED